MIDAISDALGIVSDPDDVNVVASCLIRRTDKYKVHDFSRWIKMSYVFEEALKKYHCIANIPQDAVGMYLTRDNKNKVYFRIIRAMNEVRARMENGTIPKGSPEYERFVEVFTKTY